KGNSIVSKTCLQFPLTASTVGLTSNLVGRLFQFIRHLFKRKVQTTSNDLSKWQQYKWQSYACADHHPVQILKVASTELPRNREVNEHWDCELPKGHLLRVVKSAL